MRRFLLALPLLLAAVPAAAQETIPEPVKAMLDAAMAAGDEAGVSAIVKYAAKASPDSAKAVAAAADKWRADRKAAADAKLAGADFFDLVKGRIELAAYRATGNSRDVGFATSVDLRREALHWRHTLRLQAEYAESLGQTSRERFLAAYEPNYKFDERAYLYGSAQFESDRFLGYRQRYSLSAGGGYSAIKQKDVTLNLELGPAFRDTAYTDGRREGNVAGRGSVDLDWKLNRAITLRQNASAYLQSANSTVASKTALAAKVYGPLSAQLSYTLQFESEPPAGRKTTDTTSRAALVVAF